MTDLLNDVLQVYSVNNRQIYALTLGDSILAQWRGQDEYVRYSDRLFPLDESMGKGICRSRAASGMVAWQGVTEIDESFILPCQCLAFEIKTACEHRVALRVEAIFGAKFHMDVRSSDLILDRAGDFVQRTTSGIQDPPHLTQTILRDHSPDAKFLRPMLSSMAILSCMTACAKWFSSEPIQKIHNITGIVPSSKPLGQAPICSRVGDGVMQRHSLFGASPTRGVGGVEDDNLLDDRMQSESKENNTAIYSPALIKRNLRSDPMVYAAMNLLTTSNANDLRRMRRAASSDPPRNQP